MGVSMDMNLSEVIRRGEIWLADLSGTVHAEQSGTMRPVLILSNDQGNRHSPVVTAIPITTKIKKRMPTHAKLQLKEESYALLEQVRCISKFRLLHKVDQISEEEMNDVCTALLVSVGLWDLAEINMKKNYTPRAVGV